MRRSACNHQLRMHSPLFLTKHTIPPQAATLDKFCQAPCPRMCTSISTTGTSSVASNTYLSKTDSADGRSYLAQMIH